MSFLLKDAIHGTLADSVYSEVLTRRSNYYFYIGKVAPWEEPLVPDSPQITKTYEDETRNKIISVKRIAISDVSYVVPRIDWTTGTVYDQYDPDYSTSNPSYSGATSLKSSQFYVLTSDFNVYKCLFNNNNSASTDQPTGTDPTPITTSDNYVWKFMYTIPLSSRTRFLTPDFMPVQKSVLTPFYSDGQIDSVTIDSSGSGYLANDEVTLSVSGEFRSNVGNATANIVAVLSTDGSFENIYIRDQGNNYSSANIIITDNRGTGVSKYYGLSNITITNPGVDYTADVVANTTARVLTTGAFQPNSNAVIDLVFQSNSLTDIIILDRGAGYTPNVAANTTIEITTTGAAVATTNAAATASFARTAIFTPVLSGGKLVDVLIDDPGVNYSANVQTTIVATGDGSNAAFLPFVNDAGQVEDVIIISRGNGYTFVDLEVVGDGTGANLSVNLSSGDLDTTQSTVELSAVDGGLYTFKINDAGEDYTSANIIVTGDGTGFQGNVVLSNANTISYITVTNPGSGYTFANVVIEGNGANANIQAIFPPYGGHGFDSVRELFADTLIFYSTINNERIHQVDVNNDYRQFGIIKDIEQFGSKKNFANVIGTPCYLVTLDTVTDSLSNTLARDTVLELVSSNATRQFEVVEVISANTQVLLTSLNNYAITAGDVLTEPNTISTFTVSSVDAQPTINKFSGDLLYIDNRTSVSYSDEQLVTLRTILKL